MESLFVSSIDIKHALYYYCTLCKVNFPIFLALPWTILRTFFSLPHSYAWTFAQNVTNELEEVLSFREPFKFRRLDHFQWSYSKNTTPLVKYGVYLTVLSHTPSRPLCRQSKLDSFPFGQWGQCNMKKEIYQSCLAAFLTFASKSCGPSYNSTNYLVQWLYTFPQYEIVYDAILWVMLMTLHNNTGYDAIQRIMMQSSDPWILMSMT